MTKSNSKISPNSLFPVNRNTTIINPIQWWHILRQHALPLNLMSNITGTEPIASILQIR